MLKSLFIATALFVFQTATAQEHKIDINQLIEESQINTGESGEIKMNWWIPNEFWIATFQNEPSLSQSDIDEFMKVLEPYSLFAVIDGEVGPFGGVTYTAESAITQSITLTDNNGKQYRPLSNSEISSDLQNFLSMFKPILINMIGQMGQNMHFFVFADKDAKGNRIADPTQKGKITVNVVGEEYVWKTPLGSVIPQKYCPEDGEAHSGAWEYCPYHGSKLTSK